MDNPPEGEGSGTDRANERERRKMMRLSAAGFELASFALILGAVGYGLDQYWTTSDPIFTALGVVLGFSLGFFRLIVLVSKT